ncbi:hypothetical protein PACTADRAFT_49702 [Pachysolen tannophilus NRRL Y-2460]|uniref:Uncharacterized protein n=1 Tax=Pachysolen tannophilus NRRL Y-2460 TaxID=669874 RepID=A0A1E4TX89_PACTA|nr:hypothetical protein PACTADRAFT_49702 [Pachysolen tannophilus NRRL Y-2460]
MDVIPDSDVELEVLGVPVPNDDDDDDDNNNNNNNNIEIANNSNRNEIDDDKGNENLSFRRSVSPLETTRNLRRSDFFKRHVYTVDFALYLKLSTRQKLQELSKLLTDEEILKYLNNRFLRNRRKYLKRNTNNVFTKSENLNESIEKYKRNGRSFYNFAANFTSDSESEDEIDNLNSLNKKTIDDMNNIADNRDPINLLISAENPREKEHMKKLKPVTNINLDNNEHPLEPVTLTDPEEDIIDQRHENSNDEEEIEEIEEIEEKEEDEKKEDKEPVHNAINVDQQINFENFVERPSRGLRQKKFSQNHIYTVDLASVLNLSTTTELDDLSKNGKSEEEIMDLLNKLYLKQKRKNNGDKYRYNSFSEHLFSYAARFDRNRSHEFHSDNGENQNRLRRKSVEIESHSQDSDFNPNELSNNEDENSYKDDEQNIAYELMEHANQPSLETYLSRLELHSESEIQQEYSDEEEREYKKFAKKLKGVLPGSYLKQNWTSRIENQHSKRYRIQADRRGLAKRKRQKISHLSSKDSNSNDYDKNFINDLELDENDDNLEFYHRNNVNVETGSNGQEDLEVIVISPDEDEQQQYESIEEFEDTEILPDSKFESSSFDLFGFAEEDYSSGINYMLSRNNRTNSDIKKQRSASSKRYDKRFTTPKKKTTIKWTQQQLPFREIGLDDDEEDIASAARVDSYINSLSSYSSSSLTSELESLRATDRKFHKNGNKIKNINQNRARPFMLPLSGTSRNNGESSSFQQNDFLRKKKNEITNKKAQSHFGILPDLNKFELSRNAQMLTTIVESRTNKYRLLNKNVTNSKSHLAPLEPTKYYERGNLRSHNDEDNIYDYFKNNYITEGKKSDYGIVHDLVHECDDYSNKDSVFSEILKIQFSFNSSIDTIRINIKDNNFILTKFNAESSRQNIKKSVEAAYDVLKSYILRKGSIDENELYIFLKKLCKYVLITSDVSYADSFFLCSQLFKVADLLLDGLASHKRKNDQPLMFLVVAISFNCLLFWECRQIYNRYNPGRDMISVDDYLLELFGLYFYHLINTFSSEHFEKALIKENGTTSYYYESLFIIKSLCESPDSIPELSYWSLITEAFEKSVTTTRFKWFMEYILIFASFSKRSYLHKWGPVYAVIDKFIKNPNLISQDLQLAFFEKSIELIFELHENFGWELEEEVIIRVYNIIGCKKFGNFKNEPRDFSVRLINGNRSTLAKYFSLLRLYLSKSGSKNSKLIEKIVPVSHLRVHENDGSWMQIFCNRINLLLTYSDLFHKDYSNHLLTLMKPTLGSNDINVLEIELKASLLIFKLNLGNSFQIPYYMFNELFSKVVEKCNNSLNGISQWKDEEIAKINCILSDFVNEISFLVNSFKDNYKMLSKTLRSITLLFSIQFQSTLKLNKLLDNLIRFSKTCMDCIKMIPTSERVVVKYINGDFFQRLSNLIKLEISSITDKYLHYNEFLISRLIILFCDVADYLVQHNLNAWHTLLWSWSFFGTLEQRSHYELVFYEKILQYVGFDVYKSHIDEFFGAFARNLPKLSNSNVFKYLLCLYKKDSNNPFLSFRKEVNLNNITKLQFDSSRVQIVITFIINIKKASRESTSSFKKSEFLLNELVSGLRQEYQLQKRKIIQFNWYSHFTTKIVKYINYSSLDLVKTSKDFSFLRKELNISTFENLDHSSEFKHKLVSCKNEADKIIVIEEEFISSIIQRSQVEFIKNFKSSLLETFKDAYYEDDAELFGKDYTSSLFFSLCSLISIHLHLASIHSTSTNWYFLYQYTSMLVDSVVDKGSLCTYDLHCILNLVDALKHLASVKLNQPTFLKLNLRVMTMSKVYDLLVALYHLFTTYKDQANYLEFIKPYLDSKFYLFEFGKIPYETFKVPDSYIETIKNILKRHDITDIIDEIADVDIIEVRNTEQNLRLNYQRFKYNVEGNNNYIESTNTFINELTVFI